ncbi:MAG: hypothetical protein JWR18_3984 [Segetibacter sp.]|nr:hypothetical protein [Segetibacter sp.]
MNLLSVVFDIGIFRLFFDAKPLSLPPEKIGTKKFVNPH